MADPPPGDREYYTIPANSSWFRWDEIHEVEKSSLPEFFESSSISRNPRAYKEYRDFIINKYREDPAKKLTFTELRRSLVGDVGSLHKVFTFLDKWGLVNFSACGGRDAAQAEGDDGFPKVVVEGGPPCVMKVVGRAKREVGLGVKTAGKEGRRAFLFPPLTSYNNVFANGKAQVAPVCAYCRERCLSGHYESKKENLIACTKCFQNEDNKRLNSADDLNFVENEDGDSKMLSDDWSDIETMHLLEGIIAKKNDWAVVSDQVRRNKLDCIARLIQLPLGEHMLDYINSTYDERNLVNQRNNEPCQCVNNEKEPTTLDFEHHMNIDREEELEEETNIEQPLKKRHMLSWPDATDSFTRQVANVSSVAGPRIAAVAAEAAIMALCNESPYARKVFKTKDETGNDSNNELDCSSDPMDAEKFETGKESTATANTEPGLVKNFGRLTFKMRAAIATAFGSASARAKLLADQEEREMEHLMASIVKMQVKKIHSKIKYFDDLELIMEKEYIQIQQLKKSILSEWVAILETANRAGISNWRGRGFSKPLGGHTF